MLRMPPSPRYAAIRCTHLFLEFFDELRFAAGADSGADDGFERGRCGAIWGWGIWGRAARKKGALCHASLVARPGSCVREIAGGRRCAEVGFGRFLRNEAVTVAGLSAAAAERTGYRAAGRDVLAIQDTSEIVLGGAKVRAKGFGPVGKGGNLGGVLLHPVLTVDARSGEVLGLADISVRNRDKGKVGPRADRSKSDKESRRWLDGARRAGEVLARARRITVVSDRESDIYEDFARKPDNVDLLVRANHNRRLEEGDLLFDYANSLPEGERFVVAIPASPGRAPRKATLALRFGAVTICRPGSGMPAADAKTLPKTIRLHLVDIVEVAPPDGVASIHWRLLTTHAVENIGQARLMLDFYRKRWIIEEFFRTLKSAGFQVEAAEIGDPDALMKFLALAAIAAVTVTQLVRARDNPHGQSLIDAFDQGDQTLIEAICADYEGPNPTKRQTNPHPKGTMAFATWVIARLGAWTGYYGKPGPRVLNRGLQEFHAIKYGAKLARGNV
jgi:hypothetical protein